MDMHSGCTSCQHLFLFLVVRCVLQLFLVIYTGYWQVKSGVRLQGALGAYCSLLGLFSVVVNSTVGCQLARKSVEHTVFYNCLSFLAIAQKCLDLGWIVVILGMVLSSFWRKQLILQKFESHGEIYQAAPA